MDGSQVERKELIKKAIRWLTAGTTLLTAGKITHDRLTSSPIAAPPPEAKAQIYETSGLPTQNVLEEQGLKIEKPEKINEIKILSEISADDKNWPAEDEKLINNYVIKIYKFYLENFGPPNKPEGKVPIRRGEKGGTLAPSPEFPAGAIEIPNAPRDPRNIKTVAHEMAHIWNMNCPEVTNLISSLGVEVFTDEGVAWAMDWLFRINEEVEKLGPQDFPVEVKVFYHDPDFYKKIKLKYQKLGILGYPQKIVDGSTWLTWAEEVSPGFNSWWEAVQAEERNKFWAEINKTFDPNSKDFEREETRERIRERLKKSH